MDVANILFCTGDPVLDLYAFGSFKNSKFQTTKVVRNHGGALNVWKNAEAILGKNRVIFVNPVKAHLPILLKDTVNFYTVTRYILEDDERLVLEASTTPTHNKAKFYSNRLKNVANELSNKVNSIINPGTIGLIVSDYNKGAFNSHSKHRKGYMPDFDFCVVDSRYRSLDIELIQTCKVKIWHATNKEYDPEYAKNFHYILHTNASSPVRILTGEGEILFENHPSLTVPNTTIVNTCGAGDTFTAAVASYLIDKPKVNKQYLLEACEFAIRCCQEVIQTRCTTQTTIKLE